MTIDLPTLAGLADLPGYLAGHGLIDADYARELAANGDWQLLLTEAADLAATFGLVDVIPGQGDDVRPEGREGDERPGEGEGAGAGAGAGAQSDGSGGAAITSTGTGTGTGINVGGHTVLNPLGHGRRRRKLTFPTRPAKSQPCATAPNPTDSAIEYSGAYTLTAHIEDAVAADPAVAEALHPDGHGGFLEPPVGALTYRPSSELAKCVRQRDRTCRHPGCDVPAAACEIDHVVPYRHYDPQHGGWTVLTNLHCLCRYHHMLKTMGVWVPVMLSHGIDYWTSSSGSTAVTLPGGTVGATDLSDCRLIPHIPCKRRPHCSLRQANKNIPDSPGSTSSPGSAVRTGSTGNTGSTEDADPPAPF